jgi:hypothetical protein
MGSDMDKQFGGWRGCASLLPLGLLLSGQLNMPNNNNSNAQ